MTNKYQGWVTIKRVTQNQNDAGPGAEFHTHTKYYAFSDLKDLVNQLRLKNFSSVAEFKITTERPDL